jgi:hypothetical protein
LTAAKIEKATGGSALDALEGTANDQAAHHMAKLGVGFDKMVATAATNYNKGIGEAEAFSAMAKNLGMNEHMLGKIINGFSLMDSVGKIRGTTNLADATGKSVQDYLTAAHSFGRYADKNGVFTAGAHDGKLVSSQGRSGTDFTAHNNNYRSVFGNDISLGENLLASSTISGDAKGIAAAVGGDHVLWGNSSVREKALQSMAGTMSQYMTSSRGVTDQKSMGHQVEGSAHLTAKAGVDFLGNGGGVEASMGGNIHAGHETVGSSTVSRNELYSNLRSKADEIANSSLTDREKTEALGSYVRSEITAADRVGSRAQESNVVDKQMPPAVAKVLTQAEGFLNNPEGLPYDNTPR